MAAIDDLIAQIKGQNTTSKWSGGFGVDDATRDMARILNSIGITDIKQFGKIPTYEEASIIGKNSDGTPVYGRYVDRPVYVVDSETGQNVQQGYDGGFEPVNQSDLTFKDGKPLVKSGETFGNKLTGQAVPNTYSERQTGNAWGGTFAGKGNTGYRVDFTPAGTPVFYTTGASSNDLANFISDLGPIGSIAANYLAFQFGGPAGVAALNAAQGKDFKDVAKATLLAYAGQELNSAVGGKDGLLGGTGDTSALDAGMDVYGSTGNIGMDGLNAGLDAYPSTGDIGGSPLDAGMDVYPNTGDIGTSGLDAGMDVYPSTGNIEPSALDAGMGDYPSTGTIGAEPTTPSLIDKAKEAASKLTVSDALRAAGLVGSVVGAGKIADSLAGTSGNGAFDIVPVPSDWKSPPPTTVAEFTPLAPIDFGNKEMLQGTQWEKLLSPTYGQTPPMPTQTNPSNMTFDQLTKILGGSRESIPTQSLSINDVIAGIQSQYGQTPQGSMGQKPA